MLRMGIVGLGGIGRHHLSRYPQVPRARVVAVADVRLDALRADPTLAEQLGELGPDVAWFADYRDLYASGLVDAVDICLPTDLHREAASTALDAGLQVLCEKPMALTLEECDAMLEAADRSSGLLMIAQCIRFWPEYGYLTDLYRSAATGALLSLHLSRQGRRPGGTWMGDARRSGGAILDLHIHDVDYAHALLGVPGRVYAQGGQSAGAGRGYDYVLANLAYRSGLQVSVAAHWADVPLPFAARYEARFERAFLRFDSSQSPSLVVYHADRAEPEHPAFGGSDAYGQEIAYFVDCALSGQLPVRCPAGEARNSVALVMAEIASIAREDLVDTAEWVR